MQISIKLLFVKFMSLFKLPGVDNDEGRNKA